MVWQGIHGGVWETECPETLELLEVFPVTWVSAGCPREPTSPALELLEVFPETLALLEVFPVTRVSAIVVRKAAAVVLKALENVRPLRHRARIVPEARVLHARMACEEYRMLILTA